MKTDNIVQRILSDLGVGLAAEFDKNFERQAFFNEAWKRKSSPIKGSGHLLVDTGALRRSLGKKSDDKSVTFYSTSKYAAIHNNGGEIRVTARMKGFFWHKYYEVAGHFKWRKSGALSQSKRQVQLSAEATFWKAMALMKAGSVIKIPRRRFLGVSPDVERLSKEIVHKGVMKYIEQLPEKIRNGIKNI